MPVRDIYRDHWSITGTDVPGYGAPVDSNYLPGRNLLLLSKVAVFCSIRGIRRIATAPLADNPFPDATAEFFQTFERVAGLALGAPIRIELPYRGIDKTDVVRRAHGLPIELTFSCARPVGTDHCGRCTKCEERQRAFREAGVPDPTRYRRVPDDAAAPAAARGSSTSR
jgi:7-cyano-7-deazaguanine synthase